MDLLCIISVLIYLIRFAGVASTQEWIPLIFCRLLHLGLLAFNALAIRSLSAVSGGHKSIFSKKENAQAALLVASQVAILS